MLSCHPCAFESAFPCRLEQSRPGHPLDFSTPRRPREVRLVGSKDASKKHLRDASGLCQRESRPRKAPAPSRGDGRHPPRLSGSCSQHSLAGYSDQQVCGPSPAGCRKPPSDVRALRDFARAVHSAAPFPAEPAAPGACLDLERPHGPAQDLVPSLVLQTSTTSHLLAVDRKRHASMLSETSSHEMSRRCDTRVTHEEPRRVCWASHNPMEACFVTVPRDMSLGTRREKREGNTIHTASTTTTKRCGPTKDRQRTRDQHHITDTAGKDSGPKQTRKTHPDKGLRQGLLATGTRTEKKGAMD